MNKTDLLNKIFKGFPETLGNDLFLSLRNPVNKFLNEHGNDNDLEFIRNLYKEFPELEKIESIYIRSKLTSLSKNIRILTTLAVITFLASLVAVIFIVQNLPVK